MVWLGMGWFWSSLFRAVLSIESLYGSYFEVNST
jgi:hypothetical protein